MICIREITQTILCFLRKVLIVEIIILVVATILWCITTALTKDGFVAFLFIVGAITIIVGVCLRAGSREGTYDFTYQYLRTSGNTTQDERNKLDREDMLRSYADLMVLFTAGIVAFLLCVLIDVIF